MRHRPRAKPDGPPKGIKTGRKKDDEDLPDEEGKAGKTVVHIQCPRCKKLFKSDYGDPFCPYCDYDTSKTPTVSQEHKMEHMDPKHILLYLVLVLTIFTGLLLVYYIMVPDPEAESESEGKMLSIGLVLFPFGVCLVALVVMLFVTVQRSRIHEGLRSKLILSGLLGAFISCLVIGLGKIGGFFAAESYKSTWLKDTETTHNLFIIIALFSLVLLGGYFYYLHNQKKKGETQ
jgi:hypothetical protein